MVWLFLDKGNAMRKNVEKMWICGRFRRWDHYIDGASWDLMGVFSSRSKALKACEFYTDFIFSTKLDELLPDKSEIPPDLVYPISI